MPYSGSGRTVIVRGMEEIVIRSFFPDPRKGKDDILERAIISQEIVTGGISNVPGATGNIA